MTSMRPSAGRSIRTHLTDFGSAVQLRRSAAVVEAVRHYDDPATIARVSRGLGEAMVGINVADLPAPHRLAERGW